MTKTVSVDDRQQIQVKPNEEQLKRLTALTQAQGDWRNRLVETGRKLAKLLQSEGDLSGILKIIHRADGGGGGAAKVAEIWEDVKIELEKILLRISISKPIVPTENSTATDDDLMTRKQISAVSGVALQTLYNQSERFLGEPAVDPGKGRGKEQQWHYLAIKSKLEAETADSMPSLAEARQIIATKQNV